MTLRTYYYLNDYTEEIYCSAGCALEATLEGIVSTVSDERAEELLEATSVYSNDWTNVEEINNRVRSEDALGRVTIIRQELDPHAVWVCDKCFTDMLSDVDSATTN
jgi:hypothetical protein